MGVLTASLVALGMYCCVKLWFDEPVIFFMTLMTIYGGVVLYFRYWDKPAQEAVPGPVVVLNLLSCLRWAIILEEYWPAAGRQSTRSTAVLSTVSGSLG